MRGVFFDGLERYKCRTDDSDEPPANSAIETPKLSDSTLSHHLHLSPIISTMSRFAVTVASFSSAMRSRPCTRKADATQVPVDADSKGAQCAHCGERNAHKPYCIFFCKWWSVHIGCCSLHIAKFISSRSSQNIPVIVTTVIHTPYLVPCRVVNGQPDSLLPSTIVLLCHRTTAMKSTCTR
jgi:hypothetical protein